MDALPLVGRFERALLEIDVSGARELLAEAAEDLPPTAVVDSVIAPALERIGAAWERGDAALSQVYMSGRICEGLVSGLLPPGVPQERTRARLGIAVLEDFHSLGKDLVRSALRGAGFAPLDLGHTDLDELVERVRSERIDLLLVSTLMLPSALRVKELRQRLDTAGLRVKVVVGGAPFRFDRDLWREVGADACGQNALEAIEIVRRLLPETGATEDGA